MTVRALPPTLRASSAGNETLVELTLFLGIDGDAERLKDPRRHVASATGCLWYGAFNSFAQLVGGTGAGRS